MKNEEIFLEIKLYNITKYSGKTIMTLHGLFRRNFTPTLSPHKICKVKTLAVYYELATCGT